MTTADRKETLRREMRQQRQALPLKEQLRASETICAHLKQHPLWHSAQTVAIYVSCRCEVHTHALVQQALETGTPRLVAPKVEATGLTLNQLRDWSDLQRGAYGILEPRPGLPEVASEAVELFLVPGLAFGPQGERLGQGGGYYDRLLAGSKAYRIGLAYEFQCLSTIPTEPHDIQVDAIATETGVWPVLKKPRPGQQSI